MSSLGHAKDLYVDDATSWDHYKILSIILNNFNISTVFKIPTPRNFSVYHHHFLSIKHYCFPLFYTVDLASYITEKIDVLIILPKNCKSYLHLLHALHSLTKSLSLHICSQFLLCLVTSHSFFSHF